MVILIFSMIELDKKFPKYIATTEMHLGDSSRGIIADHNLMKLLVYLPTYCSVGVQQ